MREALRIVERRIEAFNLHLERRASACVRFVPLRRALRELLKKARKVWSAGPHVDEALDEDGAVGEPLECVHVGHVHPQKDGRSRSVQLG